MPDVLKDQNNVFAGKAMSGGKKVAGRVDHRRGTQYPVVAGNSTGRNTRDREHACGSIEEEFRQRFSGDGGVLVLRK